MTEPKLARALGKDMTHETHASHSGRLPYGPIEMMACITTCATIDPWSDDLTQYTVWQLQQLRRVAKCMRRMAWRDMLIRSDELMSATRLELTARGAVTCRVKVDDTVSGGTTDEDYETGRVLNVEGNQVTVQWHSGETTTQDASVLTVE